MPLCYNNFNLFVMHVFMKLGRVSLMHYSAQYFDFVIQLTHIVTQYSSILFPCLSMLFTMTVFQYILLFMYSSLSKLAAIRSLTAMAFLPINIPLINDINSILMGSIRISFIDPFINNKWPNHSLSLLYWSMICNDCICHCVTITFVLYVFMKLGRGLWWRGSDSRLSNLLINSWLNLNFVSGV